jgi:small subunit ribosomal protein S16
LLVIRLARTGRAKYPTYRIVAAESARAATGKFVAILGHYNPHTKELVLKTDDIKKHLSNGAQPSNTVAKLLTREKVELPAWVKIKTKAPKAAEATEAAAETEAKSDDSAADTDVTPAEAESDASAAEPAASAAEPAEQERVAEVNEDEAISAESNIADIDRTETEADAAK